MQKPTVIFYGWWLVLVCTLVQAVGYGTSLYLYSVLIGAIGQEFESGRFVLMIGVSGMLLLVGLMSPQAGSLLDRYPIRNVLIVGAVIMGLGFILMSFSPNIAMVVACYAVFVAIGMTILSPLSCSLLLTRWFVRYRGLALGISALGTQLGGVVFPPIIALTISLYGWRISVAALGVFVIVSVSLLAWFFVVDHPRDKGLSIHGASDAPDADEPAPPPPASGGAPVRKISLKRVFLSRNFIIVAVIMAFMSMTFSGLLSNMSLLAIDKGQTLARGAFLVSLASMVGMVSSPLMGRISDVVSIRTTLGILCFTVFLALVIFFHAETYPALIVGAMCFGFFGGAVVPVWSATLSRLYDGRIYGRVLGASIAVVYSIAAFAAPGIGLLYDITSSYQITFVILLIGSVLVASSILALRTQQRQSAAELEQR